MRNFLKPAPHTPGSAGAVKAGASVRKPEPAIFVIFGVTGNLAQKRLLPALYHLLKDDLLHEATEIIGVSRRKLTAEELIDEVKLCVLEADKVCDPQALAKFKQRLRTFRLDPLKGDDYDALRVELDAIEAAHGTCMHRLFYLSIPPQVYEPLIQNLGTHRLQAGCPHGEGQARLLVEKPFGYDLASARELIDSTGRYFGEDQVFRIDHYLAKETVQDILVFRRQNPLFSSVWSSRYITAIDIGLYETDGVAGRAEFYDNVGALRDVIQNHLMQLLALTAMELPPDIHGSAALHAAKQALLASIRPASVSGASAIRAQYDGYRKDAGNMRSTTETFASILLDIRNRRWRGTRVRITAGKALAARKAAIVLTFGGGTAHAANKLTFRIQPNEGIDVQLVAKRPGFEHKTETVQMDFSYHGAFDEPEHPDAYERVLVDAIRGDHSLFATSGEVLEAWRILQPVLNAWELDDSSLKTYKRGSEGPGLQE